MKKAVTTLLGLGTLGVGIIGLFVPNLLARALGVKVSESSHLLMRAIGIRDFVFGFNILYQRNQPKQAAGWVMGLGVVVLADTAGRLVLVQKSGPTPAKLAQVGQSALIALACFFVGRRLAREDLTQEQTYLKEKITQTGSNNEQNS